MSINNINVLTCLGTVVKTGAGTVAADGGQNGLWPNAAGTVTADGNTLEFVNDHG